MGLREKERLLLNKLRENSRKSLAKISKETKIPVSTLFDMLKKMENEYVVRHVSLVDFSKLGYSFKVNFVLGTKDKMKLREHLMKHPLVNQLSTLINGNDFFVECLFKDLKQMTDFKEELSSFSITSLEECFVVEELKKEGFIP